MKIVIYDDDDKPIERLEVPPLQARRLLSGRAAVKAKARGLLIEDVVRALEWAGRHRGRKVTVKKAKARSRAQQITIASTGSVAAPPAETSEDTIGCGECEFEGSPEEVAAHMESDHGTQEEPA